MDGKSDMQTTEYLSTTSDMARRKDTGSHARVGEIGAGIRPIWGKVQGGRVVAVAKRSAKFCAKGAWSAGGRTESKPNYKARGLVD